MVDFELTDEQKMIRESVGGFAKTASDQPGSPVANVLLYGEKVTDPAEVRPALQRGLKAVATGQLALLDMRLQPINTSGEV